MPPRRSSANIWLSDAGHRSFGRGCRFRQICLPPTDQTIQELWSPRALLAQLFGRHLKLQSRQICLQGIIQALSSKIHGDMSSQDTMSAYFRYAPPPILKGKAFLFVDLRVFSRSYCNGGQGRPLLHRPDCEVCDCRLLRLDMQFLGSPLT